MIHDLHDAPTERLTVVQAPPPAHWRKSALSDSGLPVALGGISAGLIVVAGVIVATLIAPEPAPTGRVAAAPPSLYESVEPSSTVAPEVMSNAGPAGDRTAVTPQVPGLAAPPQAGGSSSAAPGPVAASPTVAPPVAEQQQPEQQKVVVVRWSAPCTADGTPIGADGKPVGEEVPPEVRVPGVTMYEFTGCTSRLPADDGGERSGQSSAATEESVPPRSPTRSPAPPSSSVSA